MAKEVKEIVNTTVGDNQSRRAEELALDIGSEAIEIAEQNAIKKLEIEGGSFEVMHSITHHMPTEKIANLPDPLDKTGNNPARYQVRHVVNGKEKIEDEYFYDKLALSQPTVKGWLARADQLKRSLGDPSKVKQDDIPKDIMDMELAYRQAEMEALNTKVLVAKRSVSSAFELFWQLRRIQTDNEVKVSAEILYALNKDGTVCDGKEGRPFKVEPTMTPIVITSTLPERAKIDTKRITLGSFKKFDVKKAKEAVGGATYQALFNTLAKAPTQDQPVLGNTKIQTVETAFQVMYSLAEYFRFIQEDETSKASWTTLSNKMQKDNEDFFVGFYISETMRSLVGSPRDQVRGQALTNEYGGKLPVRKSVAKAA